MGRISIRSRTGVNADLFALFLGEAAECEIVEFDEAVEERARRIELDRQTAFGEIDLDFVRPFRKTSADLLFMLGEQIPDEFLPRVSGKMFRWIHQAQGRGRNNGLFDRDTKIDCR